MDPSDPSGLDAGDDGEACKTFGYGGPSSGQYDRCGGYAKCASCRIEYLEGEPDRMTRAELEVLQSRDLLGQVRLSCQAVCDHDVRVRPPMTVTSTGLDGPGNKLQPTITPEPEWIEKPA